MLSHQVYRINTDLDALCVACLGPFYAAQGWTAK